MNYRIALALLLWFCTLLPALAQTKPDDDRDDVVKITTNLVQIDAVVTKDGKVVRDLKAEDFEIYEDGRRKEITTFAFISNVGSTAAANSTTTAGAKPDKTAIAAPIGPVKRDVARRTMAIVVDDLGMSAESMNQARRQLRKFVAEQMQPNDLVAVIRTGGEMGALQQFTNDKRMLNRAVDQLRWNPCSRVGIRVITPAEGTGGACAGMTVRETFKAVKFVLNAMGQLPGRKSMALMSDDIPIKVVDPQSEGAESVIVGEDVTNYGGWLQKLTETAIRSSVVIYSVDTQGLQYTGITAADAIGRNPTALNPAGGSVPERSAQLNALLTSRSRTLDQRREGSERIARQTGGFQVRNSNGFQLDRILDDQSGYYLIGYRPTDETFNRQFHQIKAKVKRSGMTLRTRYGFYGVSEDEANRTRPSFKDQTNLALLSPFAAQDLEIGLSSFFANGKREGATIRSFVYLNPANLTFTAANGRRETSIEVHGAIFGDNGKVVERVKHDLVLSLGESEYEQAMRAGINDAVRLRFDIPTKQPGSYQVRVAVRDKASMKIGSAGQFVAIPDLNKKQVAMSGIVLRGAAEASTPATVMTNPPGRRFQPNAELRFAFLIYNATIDPATRLPKLTLETKLFRDGKSVSQPMASTIDLTNQADLSRLFINSALRLPPDLEPGDYYLQVVVNDQAAKEKQPPVIQWVDFEIVK
jgi:VWFA-related protein